MGRLLKGVGTGAAVGMDEIGRYLAPAQRAMMVASLSVEVERRGEILLIDARAAAAAILIEAETEAEAMRHRAHAEGFATGHAGGHTAAMTALESTATLLTDAAAAADLLRGILLAGVEEQTVALALTAARQVIGAAADSHAGLAAEIVRAGMRSAGSRVVRLRVNAHDRQSVTAELLAHGHDVPVQEDVTVAIGGCIIDLEGGSVDLRLDTQMQSIERMLLDGDA